MNRTLDYLEKQKLKVEIKELEARTALENQVTKLLTAYEGQMDQTREHIEQVRERMKQEKEEFDEMWNSFDDKWNRTDPDISKARLKRRSGSV